MVAGMWPRMERLKYKIAISCRKRETRSVWFGGVCAVTKRSLIAQRTLSLLAGE